MGKFDGILLCSDLDGTLFTSDREISAENRQAIAHFAAEGGLFTFATGRSLSSLGHALSQVQPNAPLICYNGAGIYDAAAGKMIWETALPHPETIKVLEFAEAHFPAAGIEICTTEGTYFSRESHMTARFRKMESLPLLAADYHTLTMPWKKVVFMMEEEELPAFRALLQTSSFAGQYDFVQSSRHFYDLMPKGASKGAALGILAEHLGIAMENTVGVGDNENDLSLVRNAGIGVAVANATPALLDAADYISPDNNTNAVAAVIYGMEQGKIVRI